MTGPTVGSVVPPVGKGDVGSSCSDPKRCLDSLFVKVESVVVNKRWTLRDVEAEISTSLETPGNDYRPYPCRSSRIRVYTV